MLLQTLVQLHILLAATPALAGWTLLAPAGQSLPTHVIYLVARTAAEVTPLTATAPRTQSPANYTRQAPCRRFASPTSGRTAVLAVPKWSAPLPGEFHPFPHAPRAP